MSSEWLGECPCDCRGCHVCAMFDLAPRIAFDPPTPKADPAPKPVASLFPQPTGDADE